MRSYLRRPAVKSSVGVVDDVIGAERTHELDIAAAAHAGDFGAHRLGDLYGECADAARSAIDAALSRRP